MKFFSKIILLLTIFTAVFTTAAPAFAAYGLDEAAGSAGLKKEIAGGNGSIESTVGSIVSVALSMIGIIFFLLVLYAGFTWMIARGNTEAVDKSKAIIEGAVIGLIIVMAAYAITNFVFKSLDQGVATTQPSGQTDQVCPSSTHVSDPDTGPCEGHNVGQACAIGSNTASGARESTCTLYKKEGQTDKLCHCI